MVRTLKRTDAGSPLLTPEVATVQPNGGSHRVESPIEPIPPPGKAAATTGAIGTILLSTAPITLSVAAGVMVVLYAVQLDPASAIVPDWWLNWAYVIAPVVGIVAGLAVGLTFGAMRPGFSGARQSDTQSSGELVQRVVALQARLDIVCPIGDEHLGGNGSSDFVQLTCAEARLRAADLTRDLATPGAQWVSGTGVLDAWRNVHAIEELLLAVTPAEDAAGQAVFDGLRLKGSTISNSDDLIVMLQRATASLAPAAVEYSIPRPTIEPPAKPDANGALARSVLREVRRSINGFRDDKWAGLLRARTRLVWTGTLTAGIAFALLVLAVLSQAPSKEVVAAMTFYLTGAIVGLFNQLRLAAGGRSVEEDCGFSRTRLLYVPILSGIAAVVGVVLIAMLHAVNGMVLTYGEARPAIDETIPTVHNIFQLTTNPFGLVLAAIFGLTPDLLVSRLQATADRYRDDLASTEAHGTGKT